MAIALPSYLNYGNPIDRSNPLMRGLVSRWKVVPYYSSGGRLIDLAGKNHGTLTNAPTWAGGARPGGSGSLTFDGTNYVNCSSGTTFDVTTGDFTAGSWVNWTSTTSAFSLAKTTGSSTNGYDILLNAANVGGKVTARLFGASTAYDLDSLTNVWNDGKWHHIVMCRIASVLYLYIDGVSQGTLAASVNITNTSASLQFAGRNGTAFAALKGDDWFVYPTRGLSASEVFSLYNATRSRYDPTLNWYSRPMMMGAEAAPGGFKAYWARPRTRIIGGGVS